MFIERCSSLFKFEYIVLNVMLLRTKWAVPVCLVGITLVCHGVLLIADFVITDGWWMLDWMREKDWAQIKYLTYTNGLYFHRYIAGFFMLFPEPNTAIKIATVIFLFASSLLIFYILEEMQVFSTVENLFVAIVCLTFPAVRVFGNAYPVVVYLTLYLNFLICVYLALRSAKKTGFVHLLFRVTAICGFFVSFTFGSLLVFFYGFLVCLYIYERLLSNDKNRASYWNWILKKSDYVTLPFIFWFWRRTFFPGIGSNLNYQKPTVDQIVSIPSKFSELIIYTIPEQIFGGLSLLLLFPIIGVIVVLLSYSLAHLIENTVAIQLNRGDYKVRTLNLTVFASFLLFLAVFPYWVINSPISADGFESRNAFLMPIPMALYLLIIFRFVQREFHPSKVMRNSICFVIFMNLTFCCMHFNAYYDWQVISIKEKSVAHNLSKLENIAKYRLLIVQDNFILNYLYEQWGRWPYILKVVTGDYERYAYGSYEYSNAYIYPNKELVTELVIADIADPPFRSPSVQQKILTGKRGIVTIDAGKSFEEYNKLRTGNELQSTGEFSIGRRQKLAMVTWYFYYKFFKKEKLAKYLENITYVKVDDTDELFSKL